MRASATKPTSFAGGLPLKPGSSAGRRRSSIGGHLAKSVSLGKTIEGSACAIGDDIQGSAGTVQLETKDEGQKPPPVTAPQDPELEAELRQILQTPCDERTVDDILPLKRWLRATAWGRTMMESVMGLEPFRVDEARGATRAPSVVPHRTPWCLVVPKAQPLNPLHRTQHALCALPSSRLAR